MANITVTLSMSEAENICMMHNFCKRWFDHSYAVNAIAKIRKAQREVLGDKDTPPRTERTPDGFNRWNRIHESSRRPLFDLIDSNENLD